MASETREVGESRPPHEPGTPDFGGLAIAIGLAAMAALIWWDASSYPVRRSYAQFGPEIFPFLVAAGLAVFAVATVFLAVRRRFPPREEMTYPPVIWVAGAVLAEIVILTFGLGFILASGTLFGFAARGMGRKPLWLTVIVGILFSAVLYILFRLGLGLSLPTGPVERTLVGLFR